MENSEQDDEQSSQGGGFQADLIRSYLVFGRRAVASRWKTCCAVLVSGLVLTGLANAYVPRTYTCTTTLMSMANPILEGGMNGNYNPLAGASGLILSHENLERMIRDLGLVAKADERRPPLLKLKAYLSNLVSGPQSEKTKVSVLVGTLENKIQVTGAGANLTIDADWSDAQTAAELAESARESFLRARHSAEVSAFEEKVAILDEHASKLREEIEQLAQQINTRSERATAQPGATQPTADSGGNHPGGQQRVVLAPRPAVPDAALPAMKEKLADSQKKLTLLEADHERQLREENAKLADLKLRFTPAHPQVVTQQERVAMASSVPADLQALRLEVAKLSEEVKVRETLAARTSGEPFSLKTISGAAPGTASEPLPTAVVDALQKGDTDQALAQQLSGAVVRYGVLRDDIGSGRIALDTAQAAFNHRYQVIVPVETPTKPRKPKAAVIWGAGAVASLLFAFLLPVLAELRRGILVERWQVQQLQLPILAELRLPRQSD